MSGIVYILTNEAMPGLVKIGRTTRKNLEVRIKQLYYGKSGVPVPFECAFAKEVVNPRKIEGGLHKVFCPDRVNPRREFFRIDPERAVAALGLATGKDVTLDVNKGNEEISKAERSSSETLRKKRPKLDFMEMGIPIGSELEHVNLNSTEPVEGGNTVVVTGPKKVRFRDGGEELSLTEATRQLTGLENVAPTPHWSFNGRNLRDIYNETYPSDPDSG